MNQYAPTKTLNVPDDVLDVLKRMAWTTENVLTLGVITEQLDRALYVKTNKVLVALGGKWNRKSKAHIFQSDPRPGLGIIAETGQMTVIKDGYYPTPQSIGIVMAEMADILPGMNVLEPSAGTGELAQSILGIQPQCNLSVIEIDDRRRAKLEQDGYAVAGSDFLTHYATYDRIIQNPPFERDQDTRHARHAWECLPPGGILVSVIGEGAFFRNDSNALAFRTWLHDQDTEVLTLGPGAFHESGTDVRARIVKAIKR